MNRRTFLKNSAALIAGPAIVTSVMPLAPWLVESPGGIAIPKITSPEEAWRYHQRQQALDVIRAISAQYQIPVSLLTGQYAKGSPADSKKYLAMLDRQRYAQS